MSKKNHHRRFLLIVSILVHLTLFLILFAFLNCFCNATAASDQTSTVSPGSLYATSAILMDGSNQRVLYGKDERKCLPMASTTKIMTCLYALEHGTLNDVVTCSANAARAPKVHLGVQEGDQYVLSDLLYAMMLESYNDAAVAVAEHLCGSVEAFCQAMTEEAHNFGCYDTSFETPNGLDSQNHYTTSYDLAILTCRAMENQTFRSIITEPSYHIRELTRGQMHDLSNKNAFLDSYDGAIGVKTGFTSGAGYCFVGAVEKNDHYLISVVLGSGWYPNRSYKWSDTKKLMDYGMNYFSNQTITLDGLYETTLPVQKGQTDTCRISIPKGERQLLLSSEEKLSISYEIPKELTAPITKESVIGNVNVKIDEKVWRTYPVYALDQVAQVDFPFYLRHLLDLI